MENTYLFKFKDVHSRSLARRPETGFVPKCTVKCRTSLASLFGMSVHKYLGNRGRRGEVKGG